MYNTNLFPHQSNLMVHVKSQCKHWWKLKQGFYLFNKEKKITCPAAVQIFK